MKLLKLHEDCQITLGVSRSIICDFTRNKYLLVPNSLARLLQEYQGKELDVLLKDFESQSKTVLEYLDFLDAEELVFYCDSISEYERFPKLSTAWDFPAEISNAIIDVANHMPDFASIITQLEALGCQHISLRFFKPVLWDDVAHVLDTMQHSTICSVELILKDDLSLTQEKLTDLLQQHPRLIRLILFGSNEDDHVRLELGCTILKTKQLISDESYCGLVQRAYFALNIAHYMESHHHNTCLNRKLSIDTEGYIKNCPSMKEHFGNIADTSLAEAMEQAGFKQHWNTTKDKIAKCNICEFRHICTDCRAYLDNPDDACSAPLKCGYDPYTCKWEDWSTNPLKAHAIACYNL